MGKLLHWWQDGPNHGHVSSFWPKLILYHHTHWRWNHFHGITFIPYFCNCTLWKFAWHIILIEQSTVHLYFKLGTHLITWPCFQSKELFSKSSMAFGGAVSCRWKETVRYIKESEQDRGVPVIPVDAQLGTFGIEVLRLGGLTDGQRQLNNDKCYGSSVQISCNTPKIWERLDDRFWWRKFLSIFVRLCWNLIGCCLEILRFCWRPDTQNISPCTLTIWDFFIRYQTWHCDTPNKSHTAPVTAAAGVARGIVESRCPCESKAIRIALLEVLIFILVFFFPAYDRSTVSWCWAGWRLSSWAYST